MRSEATRGCVRRRCFGVFVFDVFAGAQLTFAPELKNGVALMLSYKITKKCVAHWRKLPEHLMGKCRWMSDAFWAKTSYAFLNKTAVRIFARKRVTLGYDCPNWSVLFSVFFKGFRYVLVVHAKWKRPEPNPRLPPVVPVGINLSGWPLLVPQILPMSILPVGNLVPGLPVGRKCSAGT